MIECIKSSKVRGLNAKNSNISAHQKGISGNPLKVSTVPNDEIRVKMRFDRNYLVVVETAKRLFWFGHVQRIEDSSQSKRLCEKETRNCLMKLESKSHKVFGKKMTNVTICLGLQKIN